MFGSRGEGDLIFLPIAFLLAGAHLRVTGVRFFSPIAVSLTTPSFRRHNLTGDQAARFRGSVQPLRTALATLNLTNRALTDDRISTA